MKYKMIVIKTRKPEYSSERLEIYSTNFWLIAYIKAILAAHHLNKISTLLAIRDYCVSIYIEEVNTDLFGEPQTRAFHIFDNFS